MSNLNLELYMNDIQPPTELRECDAHYINSNFVEKEYMANSPIQTNDVDDFNRGNDYDLDKIKEWTKEAHGDQKRKYTGEPYFNHCLRVAEMVREFTNDEHLYIAALMHDVLEDTDKDVTDIVDILTQSSVSREAISFIGQMVWELTDQFTEESHPFLNRKMRKEQEANRLHNIMDHSQTIKYCDLIDNTLSILKHDKAFGKVYLSEKRAILEGMVEGHDVLFNRVNNMLSEKEMELNANK